MNEIYFEAGSKILKARSDAQFGFLDIGLAGKAIVASAIVGTVQKETEESGYVDAFPDHTSTFENLASLGDWKGVAVAAGAYALSSASSRIVALKRKERAIRSDLDAYESGELVPYSRTEKVVRKVGSGLTRAAFVGTSVVVGYRTGETMDLDTAIMTGGGLTGLAGVRVGINHLKTKWSDKKAMQAYNNNHEQRGFINIDPRGIPEHTGPSNLHQLEERKPSHLDFIVDVEPR